MICPYRTPNLNEQQVLKRKYDEETQLEEMSTITTIQMLIFQECVQENCMAWKNGKCNYKED